MLLAVQRVSIRGELGLTNQKNESPISAVMCCSVPQPIPFAALTSINVIVASLVGTFAAQKKVSGIEKSVGDT